MTDSVVQGSSTTAHDTNHSDHEPSILAYLNEVIAASDDAPARSWVQQFNELNPISRLPPEILSSVFHFTAQTLPGEVLDIGWIRSVSHVCSYWRRVALDAPTLWTTLPLHHPYWAAEMLIRSRAAPLSISASFCSDEEIKDRIGRSAYKKSGAVAKAAIAHVSRIREVFLALSIDTLVESPLLIELFNCPAPVLETFTLSIDDPSHEGYALPDNMFNGYLRLRYLSLRNCSPNWHSLSDSLSNLISLSTTTALQSIPADILISVISHMKQLKILDLQAGLYFSSADETRIASSPTANLPLLESLRLCLTLRDCCYFMDHISYPNTSKVDITTCRPSRDVDNDAQVRLLALSERLIQTLDDHVKTILLSGHGIAIWTSPLEIQKQDGSVRLLLSARGMLVPGLIPAIITPLPLQHLELLAINDMCLQSTDYLSAFGDLPNLWCIIVEWKDIGFLEAFAAGLPRFDTPDSSAQCISEDTASDLKFRAVRNLTIREWQFDEEIGHLPGKPTCYEYLKCCLRGRRMAGIGLECLTLRDCQNAEREDIESLKEFVDKTIHVTATSVSTYGDNM